MKSLTKIFKAAILAGSVAVTNVYAQMLPDDQVYSSDNSQSMQIFDQVNDLPENATHIYVPYTGYHDILGERSWITENQFMRALSYLKYMGYYKGDISYDHKNISYVEGLLDQFIADKVVSDAKPEDYKNNLYTKYDMLRVHALENDSFVDHVLAQAQSYMRLEKKTHYREDLKELDGYLGLMGQDYNVGISNDGLRINAIQNFASAKTALDFLKDNKWSKTQGLNQAQRNLLNGGLALLGYNDQNERGLAQFYQDQNIVIDPPKMNLEALSLMHAHIVKDGKAFDLVEDVLYDFNTVSEKIGYAQAVLTFYGEHTVLDNKRWAHTMLNLMQLMRSMSDDTGAIKEGRPVKIYSATSQIFWDIVRWNDNAQGGEYKYPSINDILSKHSVFDIQNPSERDFFIEGEKMRYSALTDEQRESFEARFIAMPLAEFEKFLPDNAGELRKTPRGAQQITNHLMYVDTHGRHNFRDQELVDIMKRMQAFFKQRIAGRPAIQHLTDAELDRQAWGTTFNAMKQVLNYMYGGHSAEYTNDETSILFIYLQDRSGSSNALKDSGNTVYRTEYYRPVVHGVSERNYLNFRAESGDPTVPVPYHIEDIDVQIGQLNFEAYQAVDNKLERRTVSKANQGPHANQHNPKIK